jgi:cytochrome c553
MKAKKFQKIALTTLLLSAMVANAQDGEARAKKIVSGSCFLCHGAQGESSSEIFPKLAGQHWEYIAKQLANFKSGKRKSTAMADMVSKLTPEDMQAVGRYFEKMKTTPEPSKDMPLVKVGEYIYHKGNSYSGVPACASCHGANGDGTASLPKLSGQFPHYLEAQLKQFNTRERNNDNAVMHSIASKMTALEIAAVSEYLGTK